LIYLDLFLFQGVTRRRGEEDLKKRTRRKWRLDGRESRIDLVGGVSVFAGLRHGGSARAATEVVPGREGMMFAGRPVSRFLLQAGKFTRPLPGKSFYGARDRE
jgi:hypothetical protein